MVDRRSVDGDSGGPRSSGARLQEIYDVAARIFSEKGYEGASIQDIADSVGILKGSLYYYIESKEDLLFGIIDEVHRNSLIALEEWAAVDGDAIVRLRAFVEGHVLANTKNITKIGVFFHDFRSLDPERRERIITDRDRYDSYLRGIIRDGQAEGLLREDVDPKLASMAILGMMNWTYHWFREDGPKSASQVATEFANLILTGLTSTDATARKSAGDDGVLEG